MGGCALKTVQCNRKPRAEYEEIKAFVCSMLAGRMPVTVVPELADKADFGDLDLLYKPAEGLCVRDLVRELFAPAEVVTNGDVTSFNVGDFQVDLIRCANVSFAAFFYGYNDFGGLLGAMVSARGIKLSSDSLWVRLGVADQNAKLVLTNDPVAACEFLGISYDRWATASTKIDIFELLTSCSVFNPRLFQDEKKTLGRPMRVAFHAYVAGMAGGDSDVSLADAAIKYFGREADVDRLRADMRIREERAAKLNGRMFLAAGVAPKEVGAVLAGFRATITVDWLDSVSCEEVERAVLEYVRVRASE